MGWWEKIFGRSVQWKLRKYTENDARTDRIEKRHQGMFNFTYEIYKAKSKRAAMCFLARVPEVDIEAQYYVVVETPEGEFGKDTDGIYQDDNV